MAERQPNSNAATKTPFVVETLAALTLPILATGIVILRLFLRKVSKIALKIDDFLIVFSLLFVWGAWGTSYYMAAHILAPDISAPDYPSFIKASWAMDFLYLNGVNVIKFAILFFYLRALATTRTVRVWIYVLLGFVGAYSLVRILTQVFQCIPFSYFWDRSQPGHCMSGRAAIIALQSLHWATELVILGFPVPIIWGLSLPTRTKLGIAFLFLLGGITCAASGVRLYLLYYIEYKFSNNGQSLLTDGAVRGFLLVDVIELNAAVVTATLPTIRAPLLDCIKSRRGRRDASTRDPGLRPIENAASPPHSPETADSISKAPRFSVTEMSHESLDERKDSVAEMGVVETEIGPRAHRFLFPDNDLEDENAMPEPLWHPRRGSRFA